MIACIPFNVMLSQTTTIVGSNTVVTYSTSTGSPFTWVCPTGVTSIQLECWGAGGSGGGGASGGAGKAGGGGAGGSYVKNTTVTVLPGSSYAVTVGAGGAPGGTTSTVLPTPGGKTTFSSNLNDSIIAVGGLAGKWGSSGTPSATVAGSTVGNKGFEGSYNYAGGDGIAGYVYLSTPVFSGGGGAGAGSLGAGAIGFGTNPGAESIGTGGGGNGAAGVIAANTNGLPGYSPGGGGSGGFGGSAGRAGGAGGNGQVIITYLTPVENAVSNPTSTIHDTYVSNGKLVVTAAEVYNSVGKKIATVNQKTELSLKSGIYFVKSNKSIQKVIL